MLQRVGKARVEFLRRLARDMCTISFIPEMYPPPCIHSTHARDRAPLFGVSTSAGTVRPSAAMRIFFTQISLSGLIDFILCPLFISALSIPQQTPEKKCGSFKFISPMGA